MFNNELQKIVHNRLNITYKCENTHVSKIEYLKSIDKNDYHNSKIILPELLINDVKKNIEINYKNKSNTIIKNRLEQALFFVSLIFTNLYFSDDIDFDISFSKGVVINKELIINFLPIKNYYEIKKILNEANIISEIPMKLNGNEIKYSKYLKLSKIYILNKKYNHKIKIKKLKNKYISKFFIFKYNGFLFSNKSKSINDDFLPFDNEQKNLQYLYQKQMFFDKNEFFNELIIHYPNYKKISLSKYDKNDNDIKNVTRLLSFYKSLNSHVFSSSEAYGRIYMPFHYIPQEYRHCIRIGNNEKLVELFDIKCCFVFLSAKIISKNSQNDLLKNECKKIIELTSNDIYIEILKYNHILCSKTNRKSLKLSMMKWLFCNLQERRLLMSSSFEMQFIDIFFKEEFPLFYKSIIFYKTRSFYEVTNENIIKKNEKSNLPFSCFEYESNIMFNYVLPNLHKNYKDIPFISLHDAIFIPERFNYLSKELKNAIKNMMNEIE